MIPIDLETFFSQENGLPRNVRYGSRTCKCFFDSPFAFSRFSKQKVTTETWLIEKDNKKTAFKKTMTHPLQSIG